MVLLLVRVYTLGQRIASIGCYGALVELVPGHHYVTVHAPWGTPTVSHNHNVIIMSGLSGLKKFSFSKDCLLLMPLILSKNLSDKNVLLAIRSAQIISVGVTMLTCSWPASKAVLDECHSPPPTQRGQWTCYYTLAHHTRLSGTGQRTAWWRQWPQTRDLWGPQPSAGLSHCPGSHGRGQYSWSPWTQGQGCSHTGHPATRGMMVTTITNYKI